VLVSPDPPNLEDFFLDPNLSWEESDRIISASSYNQPPAMDDTLATFDQTKHGYHIQDSQVKRRR
jgi:hypothetical protein